MLAFNPTAMLLGLMVGSAVGSESMTSVASPLKAGHGVDISSLMELGGRNFTCYSKHHSELLHGFDEGLADFCNGFDPSRPWDVGNSTSSASNIRVDDHSVVEFRVENEWCKKAFLGSVDCNTVITIVYAMCGAEGGNITSGCFRYKMLVVPESATSSVVSTTSTSSSSTSSSSSTARTSTPSNVLTWTGDGWTRTLIATPLSHKASTTCTYEANTNKFSTPSTAIAARSLTTTTTPSGSTSSTVTILPLPAVVSQSVPDPYEISRKNCNQTANDPAAIHWGCGYSCFDGKYNISAKDHQLHRLAKDFCNAKANTTIATGEMLNASYGNAATVDAYFVVGNYDCPTFPLNAGNCTTEMASLVDYCNYPTGNPGGTLVASDNCTIYSFWPGHVLRQRDSLLR